MKQIYSNHSQIYNLKAGHRNTLTRLLSSVTSLSYFIRKDTEHFFSVTQCAKREQR